MEWQPNIHTVVFTSLFLVLYLIILIRNAIKNVIDIYDLLILSAVAIIPSGFIFFPKLVFTITRILGVAFPFVVMFGILFFIVFLYLYHIILRINDQNAKLIKLVQDLALIAKKVEDKNTGKQEKE